MCPRARSPRTSFPNSKLGCTGGEPPAPLTDHSHLLNDLFAQVPRQDEHDVGLALENALGRVYRNVSSREIVALLVRAAVHGEIDEFGADAAVVQQRVALRGSPVTRDRQPFALQSEQESEELALVARYALRERCVGVDADK